MLSKASGSSFPALFYSKKRLETKISFYIWSDTYKDSTSMKHYLYILFLLFLLLPPIHAQKVGLVLSGGGAKGLTHIGIIRALEENGIPIDYIAGTSMGSIVGSLYAMGYSPDEMELYSNPMTSNAGIQVMWKRNTSIISRKILQHPNLSTSVSP